jgi:hypothetical protein
MACSEIVAILKDYTISTTRRIYQKKSKENDKGSDSLQVLWGFCKLTG